MIPALSESGEIWIWKEPAPSGLHSALGQIHCYCILSSIGHITQKRENFFHKTNKLCTGKWDVSGFVIC